MKLIESERDKKTVDDSLGRYGVNVAADRTIEQCARLIMMLHAYGRGEVTMREIADCIASVQIGTAHLTRFVGGQTLQSALNKKLAVLAEKLDAADLAEQIQQEVDGD